MIATLTVARGNIERETEKAYCIDGQWFPKSQLSIWQNENEPEYRRSYFLAMPIWLAKQKGLWGFNCFGKPICALVETEQEIEIGLGPSWITVTDRIR